MKLTAIGLVIVVIGLAAQVWRLEGRVDRLENRGLTNTISNEAWTECLKLRVGCTIAVPN